MDFSPNEHVSGADLASAPITVKNIRLWDHEPLLQNYQQRQVLRSYYEFNDVDIDRYQIGGQMRQVMLSARELNIDKIPGDQSWMNRHLALYARVWRHHVAGECLRSGQRRAALFHQ